MNWTMQGRCWKFGDNLSLDDDILEFAKVFVQGVRVSDPEYLKQHVFTNLIPDFPERAKPGDIVVAGKRFGQGNPHIYGLLGMAGLGVGLIAGERSPFHLPDDRGGGTARAPIFSMT